MEATRLTGTCSPDLTGFTEFHDRHRADLFRLARFYAWNKDDAEDLVQQALHNLLVHIDAKGTNEFRKPIKAAEVGEAGADTPGAGASNIDVADEAEASGTGATGNEWTYSVFERGTPEEGRVFNWLRAVIANLAHNRRRDENVRRRRITRSKIRREEEKNFAPADPTASAEALDELDRMDARMDQLKPRQKQLIIMKSQGQTYEQMAAALGLSKSSIGKLLHRAEAALAALIDQVRDTERTEKPTRTGTAD